MDFIRIPGYFMLLISIPVLFWTFGGVTGLMWYIGVDTLIWALLKSAGFNRIVNDRDETLGERINRGNRY